MVESPDVHFDPIVKLAPVETKTLEEDEEEVFKMYVHSWLVTFLCTVKHVVGVSEAVWSQVSHWTYKKKQNK